MKKLNIISLLLISLLLISLLDFTGCNKKPGVESKLAETPEKLENIISITPLIIECSVTENGDKITYDGIGFIKTDVTINNILRDEYGIKSNSTLSILQSDDDVITPINKGGNLLLLLEKYEGPVTDNSYVIIGGNKGQIEIDGDSIKLKAIKSGKFYEDFKKYNLPQFKNLIKDKPYKTSNRTKESIEKEVKNEKELHDTNK